MGCDVFICYGRADRELVAGVTRRLEALGVSTWYDARVESGEPWTDAAARALKDASFLALFFSDECNRSPQVAREIAEADKLAKPLVPLLIEKAAPRGAMLQVLADRRWINMSPDAREHGDDIAALLARLAGKPTDKPAPPGVPLDLPDYVGLTRPDGAPVSRISGGAYALLNTVTLGAYGLVASRRAMRSFRTNLGMT